MQVPAAGDFLAIPVDGDQRHPVLDESPRQKSALAELGAAVAVADGGGFAREVEREFPEVRQVVDELYTAIAQVNAATDGAFEREGIWPPGGLWERFQTGQAAALLPFGAGERTTDLLTKFPSGHLFREIAAVPGVDMLFLGPGDMSLRLGCMAAVSDAKMLEVQKKLAAAAKKHGKAWGRPVGSANDARVIIELGAQLVAFGGEFSALYQHFSECSARFDELLGEASGQPIIPSGRAH